MTELAEVAKDVAEALGLKHESVDGVEYWHDDHEWLHLTGAELTRPHWRCACEDWLLAHMVSFGAEVDEKHTFDIYPRPGTEIVECPWPEAPARLVSAVWRKMKEKT